MRKHIDTLYGRDLYITGTPLFGYRIHFGSAKTNRTRHYITAVRGALHMKRFILRLRDGNPIDWIGTGYFRIPSTYHPGGNTGNTFSISYKD